jgi:hypothetical protein
MRRQRCVPLAIVWATAFAIGCGDDSTQGASNSTETGSSSASTRGGSGGSDPAGSGGAEGTGGASHGAGGSNGGGPPGQVDGIMAVGYGGIRVVSRDLGLTWGDRASEVADGGDDEYLLRAVAWGNGTWIATGWKYMTSEDGVSWVDHGFLNDEGILPCNIVEGLVFHDGAFYAACGAYVGGDAVSAVFRSVDGASWSDVYGTIGDTSDDTGGHLYMAARDGQLVAWGDTGVTYTSTDAMNWSILDGVTRATFCDGSFQSADDCHPDGDPISWWDDFYLRAEWKGLIQRSRDGTAYTDVYVDDQENSLYRSLSFARGYVAP